MTYLKVYIKYVAFYMCMYFVWWKELTVRLRTSLSLPKCFIVDCYTGGRGICDFVFEFKQGFLLYMYKVPESCWYHCLCILCSHYCGPMPVFSTCTGFSLKFRYVKFCFISTPLSLWSVRISITDTKICSCSVVFRGFSIHATEMYVRMYRYNVFWVTADRGWPISI